MKATAIANAIQGLIKYHGLRDPALRIPFHNSISVCADSLSTTTTVEADDSLGEDSATINGREATGPALGRVSVVLDRVRELSEYSGAFRVWSKNSRVHGKGLGFSASAFAALGTAAFAALNHEIDYVSLSETVRLGAGSATRSLAGGFSIWYAHRDCRSYAEQIASKESVDLGMVIVPVQSSLRTDAAHAEILSSPFFKARLTYVESRLEAMEKAVKSADVAAIGKLAEEDTLNLHASTMSGGKGMFVWQPSTVRVIRLVQKMRDEGMPAWYSIDTGPSVFINTHSRYTSTIARELQESGFSVLTSGVGGKPALSTSHLS